LRLVQVGATTVRRLSKERVNGFHNKHRGALHVEPEVQAAWSEVRSWASTQHALSADLHM
jgi:hypothetical protein